MLVLELFNGAKVSSPDFAPDEDKAINGACTRLAENYKLAVNVGIKEPERFFNCWFLSVDALMVMLDNVDSNESFWRELTVTRSLTFGSLNWYEDYRIARRIDPKLAEVAAATGRPFMMGAK